MSGYMSNVALPGVQSMGHVRALESRLFKEHHISIKCEAVRRHRSAGSAGSAGSALEEVQGRLRTATAGLNADPAAKRAVLSDIEQVRNFTFLAD